jgi:HNH endonuclease
LYRLFDCGALRLVECAKSGHVVHVRLPEEIRGVHVSKIAAPARIVPAEKLEGTDFLQTAALRRAIHEREGGRCFYCLRRTARRNRCLDHVVPRAKLGRNSYRNLVSCCADCNSKKADRAAEEHLRWLFRERRLDADELRRRLRALDDLAAGKLKPPVPG